jgi:hypothetical protein
MYRAAVPDGRFHCAFQPNPLADPGLRHTQADPVDDADAVAVRDDAGPRQLATTQALTGLHVRRVNAGNGDPNPNLAGTRFRLGKVGDRQHRTGVAEAASIVGAPSEPEHRLERGVLPLLPA